MVRHETLHYAPPLTTPQIDQLSPIHGMSEKEVVTCVSGHGRVTFKLECNEV